MEPTQVAAIKKARSLLVILLATSRETLLALEATGNLVDEELHDDLRRMVERSQRELNMLSAKIDADGADD